MNTYGIFDLNDNLLTFRVGTRKEAVEHSKKVSEVHEGIEVVVKKLTWQD